MYKPVFDTLSNPNFMPEANIAPFALISTTGSQPNPSRAYAMIPNGGYNTDWFMTQLAEGLIADANVHETSYENNVSQDVSAHGLTTPAFPTVSFDAQAPVCGLADGLHYVLPPDSGPAESIKSHFHMHGNRHPQRRTVKCPWIGCSSTLLCVNVPRHVRSIHLGIRFSCSNCGKTYTRRQGLARHTALMKCSGAGHAEFEAKGSTPR